MGRGQHPAAVGKAETGHPSGSEGGVSGLPRVVWAGDFSSFARTRTEVASGLSGRERFCGQSGSRPHVRGFPGPSTQSTVADRPKAGTETSILGVRFGCVCGHYCEQTARLRFWTRDPRIRGIVAYVAGAVIPINATGVLLSWSTLRPSAITLGTWMSQKAVSKARRHSWPAWPNPCPGAAWCSARAASWRWSPILLRTSELRGCCAWSVVPS